MWYMPLSSGVPGGTEAKGLFFSAGLADEDFIRTFAENSPAPATGRKISYTDWLGHGVVHIHDEKADPSFLAISRESIIKRVANILGGSHPQAGTEDAIDHNRFDPYVRLVHRYEVAGIAPATYYQLLEIAKDILASLGPFVFGSR